MLRIVNILILSILLTSCAIFKVHKMDIEQGNIMNPDMVKQLHTGMSESEVKAIMGNSVLVNTFNSEQMDYVYTLQHGYEKRQEQRIILTFQHGTLVSMSRNNS